MGQHLVLLEGGLMLIRKKYQTGTIVMSPMEKYGAKKGEYVWFLNEEFDDENEALSFACEQSKKHHDIYLIMECDNNKPLSITMWGIVFNAD
jgi:hypothetical protein